MRHLWIVPVALLASACGQTATDNAAANNANAADPAATLPTDAGTPTPMPAATDTATPQDANALTSTGWGPLTIGMTRAAAIEAAGPDVNPNQAGGADPQACEQMRLKTMPKGMLAMFEDGKLARITATHDADVKTDKGIAPGDPADKVRQAYGKSLISSPHKYLEAPAAYLTVWTRGGGADYVTDTSARGIEYEIGKDGHVDAIHAGGPAIQLVEGCA